MVQTLLFFLASNICNTTASKAIVQALDALLLDDSPIIVLQSAV